ncbi:MAG: hypothetical protein CMP23_10335 [Rickettsiales bacterium]|nr:hypothetical protein [Rickettsiales bacterium]|tara:strand:+ start:1435 stop:2028 length:594 start_codon:yes stop_codon:yes gene_type:complete
MSSIEAPPPEARTAEPTAVPLELAELQRRAQQFQRKTSRRNWIEWLAAALVAGWFGHGALTAERSLLMAGNGMLVLSAIGIGIYLLLKGRVTLAPKHSDAPHQLAREYVAALQGQTKLLRSVPFWYLAPMGAGFLMLLADFATEFGAKTPELVVLAGLIAALFLTIAWLNRRAAAKLDAEAQALLTQLAKQADVTGS